MGSDESHFNVSVESDGQSHKTVSTNHNLSEEKGEPKRYGTEVHPLTLHGMFVEVSGVAFVEVSSEVHVWYSVCGSEWCGVRVV